MQRISVEIILRQGMERHTCAVAADVYCWPAEADKGSPRTAYKNTAGTNRIKRNTLMAAHAQINPLASGQALMAAHAQINPLASGQALMAAHAQINPLASGQALMAAHAQINPLASGQALMAAHAQINPLASGQALMAAHAQIQSSGIRINPINRPK